MSAKNLSNVTLIPAVEGISRKLALRRESCYGKSVSHMGYVGSTKVTAPGTTYMGVINQQKNIIGIGKVSTNHLFMRRASLAPESSDAQITVRHNFAVAAAWAKNAATSLSALSTNQARFFAAKADLSKTVAGVSAAGFQKFRGWLFGIAMALQQDPEATLPSNYQVPDFDA